MKHAERNRFFFLFFFQILKSKLCNEVMTFSLMIHLKPNSFPLVKPLQYSQILECFSFF